MSATTPRPHRGTLFLEDARVLSQQAFAAGQYQIRLQAPRCAASATPGSFVHLSCGPELPMRRPLSIQRVSASEGWIEVLYKIVGHGLQSLTRRRVGDTVSCLGPIGRGFVAHRERPRPLLVGGGVGIPPMIFMAETLAADAASGWKPLVLMGSEIPFPFEVKTSAIAVSGIAASTNACMPLLEDWGIPSRLASLSGFDHCHTGYVTDLADTWLAALSADEREEVEMFACGPTPMLRAAAAVARRQGIPCQVSLEENMACAVGGCAGCTVLVQTADGPAMKRVCVDGPVFDAATVFSD